jgi:hypothetical protein
MLSNTPYNHVGFCVPNLEEAVAFFSDILGFEAGPLNGPVAADDDRLQGWFNVHPRAAVRFIFMTHAASGLKIELMQWQAPSQNTQVPQLSDVGSAHLALNVVDIEAAIAKLKNVANVRILARNEARGYVYFITAWGMYIQLMGK